MLLLANNTRTAFLPALGLSLSLPGLLAGLGRAGPVVAAASQAVAAADNGPAMASRGTAMGHHDHTELEEGNMSDRFSVSRSSLPLISGRHILTLTASRHILL